MSMLELLVVWCYVVSSSQTNKFSFFDDISVCVTSLEKFRVTYKIMFLLFLFFVCNLKEMVLVWYV